MISTDNMSRNAIVIICLILCAISVQVIVQGLDQNIEEEEIRARSFLDELNDELNERKNEQTTAEWNYNINITKENEERKNDIAAENAEFYKVRNLLFGCFAVIHV